MHLFLTIATLAFAALAGASDEYQIGPNDVIDIKVHGHDFGRTGYVVGADGTVSFPYVGQVHVASKTAVEAAASLTEALRDGYLVEPNVTVQIAMHKSHRVEVLGSVKKPGLYYLEGPTSARTLVARAGGLDLAEAGEVLVKRDGETIRISVIDLEGQGGTFPIHAGDVLTVDSSSNVVYLAGEVKKSGAIRYSEGLTVSQALIEAGGDSGLGRLAGAYVLRDGDRISVNLRRILKGKDADLQLQPGDKVVIPESAI